MNRKLVTAAATLLAVGALSVVEATPSEAATPTKIEARAFSIAKSKKGDPYHFGSAGPSRFDCSGLTSYSFKHAGRSLPRTASAQYHSSRIKHVSAKSRKVGDLVFFHSGGSIYHVGFYAGHGNVYSAPHTGARVRTEKIWTKSVYYGRLR